jgi:hypothetical protein
MKRSWNPILWGGFALVLAGIASYPLFFIRFALTRDFPWANLLLLAVATWLLVAGVLRAFKRPQAYRGKVSGPILASLSVLLIGSFLVSIFYIARNLPASKNAPRAGEIAPDFTLPDSTGHPVTLSNLLNQPFGTNDWPVTAAARGKTNGAVLIFYRGYW